MDIDTRLSKKIAHNRLHPKTNGSDDDYDNLISDKVPERVHKNLKEKSLRI